MHGFYVSGSKDHNACLEIKNEKVTILIAQQYTSMQKHIFIESSEDVFVIFKSFDMFNSGSLASSWLIANRIRLQREWLWEQTPEILYKIIRKLVSARGDLEKI